MWQLSGISRQLALPVIRLQRIFHTPSWPHMRFINSSLVNKQEWCQVNYFSWMDSRKVNRAWEKVKGTGKWQINGAYLVHTCDNDLFVKVISS
jgi:hypothetical protein